MKCTSVKLHNRKDTINNRNLTRTYSTNNTIEFVTKEYHRFYFDFLRSRHEERFKSLPEIKITNVRLPETLPPLNNGMSLERWAKKTPRLRSSRRDSNREDTTQSCSEEYDISFDVSHLLNDLDKDQINNDDDIDNNSTTYIEYDVHSDIEELINKSRRASEEYEKRKEEKRKRQKTAKSRKDHEDKAKRKVKKKLKKTIKFSLSKPQSPETEQIIRVDITSNMSLEEFQSIQDGKRQPGESSHDGRRGAKMIDDSRSGDLSESLHTDRGLRLNKEDEDFIILCKQLVISRDR